MAYEAAPDVSGKTYVVLEPQDVEAADRNRLIEIRQDYARRTFVEPPRSPDEIFDFVGRMGPTWADPNSERGGRFNSWQRYKDQRLVVQYDEDGMAEGMIYVADNASSSFKIKHVPDILTAPARTAEIAYKLKTERGIGGRYLWIRDLTSPSQAEDLVLIYFAAQTGQDAQPMSIFPEREEVVLKETLTIAGFSDTQDPAQTRELFGENMPPAHLNRWTAPSTLAVSEQIENLPGMVEALDSAKLHIEDRRP